MLCDIKTLQSHQNIKPNDAKMNQFFITPIFIQLVKTRNCVCVKRRKLCNCHSSLLRLRNAKSFVSPILLCFFFFLLLSFSGRTPEKLFREGFMISYQETVWSRSDSFLGHTKYSFHKYYSRSCYGRRVWLMSQLMHGNQHSKHPPKKHKRQSARNSETS